MQDKISELADDAYLKINNKTNCRQLTNKETDELEKYKFQVLCSMSPNAEYSNDDIINILKEPKCIPNIVDELCSVSIKKFGNKATLDNIRDIRASVYSLYFTEESNG